MAAAGVMAPLRRRLPPQGDGGAGVSAAVHQKKVAGHESDIAAEHDSFHRR